ncbi:MAG: hypothetical protein ABWJ99_01210 [Caldimicrobium sp.]
MLLKIKPVKPLLHLLFKARSKNFLETLEDYLSKNFEKKRPYLFEIKEENLLKLNDLLHTLKETFSADMGGAPLPVILFLTERDFSSPDSLIFRPGKIYFSKDIKNKISKALSESKLFYKLIKISEDFEELLFPSTVEPNFLFNFKDVLFVPLEKSCFFCQSYLHETTQCPGLKIWESFERFKELLNYSLVDISKNLKEAYQNQQITESFWDYFYIRHFYFFPSFLKIPFYLHEEIDNWASLWKPLQIPLRGGELFLALEDLIYQRYKSAETKFKALGEEDFRIHLGLMMLSLLELDFQRALYHIENALTLTNNPFVLSYLYLTKGFIYHYQKEFITAYDNYRSALTTDSSCIPAFYLLHLLNYEEEENFDKIFPFFQHPLSIYLAFLEPKFIKHERELEIELEKAFSMAREEAVNRLKDAEDKYHKLKEIMTEREKTEYFEKIKEIQNKVYQGGIRSIEDASKKALELSLELSGYLITKQKAFKRELEKAVTQYRVCEKFWQEYPYKVEDVIFGQKLKTAFELIQRINKRLLRSDLAKEIKFITQEIQNLTENLKFLLELKPQLEKKWKFRKKLLKFLIRFSTLEGALVIFFSLPVIFPSIGGKDSFFNVSNFFILSFVILILILLMVAFEGE